jgi:Beta-lactamase/Resolvase, N terminal domain
MKTVFLIVCFATTTAFAAPPPSAIASMERSVNPLVVIRGEQHPPVSLTTRMAQLNVNAVSIAVMRDRKLDWARAYGFADKERKIVATPDTLFQAGSISKPVTALAALKRVDAIVVWRLDRWGRSLLDLIATLQELHAVGVGFVSLTEALDMTTPGGPCARRYARRVCRV